MSGGDGTKFFLVEVVIAVHANVTARLPKTREHDKEAVHQFWKHTNRLCGFPSSVVSRGVRWYLASERPTHPSSRNGISSSGPNPELLGPFCRSHTPQEWPGTETGPTTIYTRPGLDNGRCPWKVFECSLLTA